jgi:hypothetical protein
MYDAKDQKVDELKETMVVKGANYESITRAK